MVNYSTWGINTDVEWTGFTTVHLPKKILTLLINIDLDKLSMSFH